MNEEFLHKLSQAYALPQLTLQEKISVGFMNHNYVLSSGANRYFLKHYVEPQKENVEATHRVKKFFAEGGVPVVLPITYPLGTVFTHEGQHYALFPFVTGKFIDHHKEGASLKSFAEMGTLLGKIHLLSKEHVPDIIQPGFKKWDKEQFLKDSEMFIELINAKEGKDDFDEKSLESLLFKRAVTLADPRTIEDFAVNCDHITHGDYYSQNMFFNEDDTIKHLFDFEKARLVPRMAELVRALDVACFEGEFDDKNFEEARVYIQAYHKVYPVHPQEFRDALEIYYVRGTQTTWIEHQHYLRGNYRTDIFMDMELKKNYYLKDNREVFANRLLGYLDEVNT